MGTLNCNNVLLAFHLILKRHLSIFVLQLHQGHPNIAHPWVTLATLQQLKAAPVNEWSNLNDSATRSVLAEGLILRVLLSLTGKEGLQTQACTEAI